MQKDTVVKLLVLLFIFIACVKINLAASCDETDCSLEIPVDRDLFCKALESKRLYVIEHLFRENNDYKDITCTFRGNEWDILQSATFVGSFEIVQYLVEVIEMDVNAVRNNYTAFLLAIIKDHFDIAFFLEPYTSTLKLNEKNITDMTTALLDEESAQLLAILLKRTDVDDLGVSWYNRKDKHGNNMICKCLIKKKTISF